MPRSPKPDYRKRRFHTVSLSSATKSVVNKEFRRRGFTVAEVVTQWPNILGQTLAEVTHPVKLTYPVGRGDGGTLLLMVVPGFGLAVESNHPLIIERINTHFGHPCVSRLKLLQGPLPVIERPQNHVLDPEQASEGRKLKVKALVGAVQNDDLRERLRRIGQLIDAK